MVQNEKLWITRSSMADLAAFHSVSRKGNSLPSSRRDACFGTHTRLSKVVNLFILPHAISIARRPFRLQFWTWTGMKEVSEMWPPIHQRLEQVGHTPEQPLVVVVINAKRFEEVDILWAQVVWFCQVFNLQRNQRISSWQDPVQNIFPECVIRKLQWRLVASSLCHMKLT